MDEKIKKYKGDAPYSYALGAAPTVELLRHRREAARVVYLHPDYAPRAGSPDVRELSREAGVPCRVDAAAVARLSPKENAYAVKVPIYGTKFDALKFDEHDGKFPLVLVVVWKDELGTHESADVSFTIVPSVYATEFNKPEETQES